MHRRLLILFVLFGNFISAQNLVVNPGFEISDTAYTSEPLYLLSGMNLLGWNAPTDGTPDSYFMRPEQIPEVSRPTESADRAFEGHGYVGFYNTKTWEYLKGTLTETLAAGTNYTVCITIGAQHPEMIKDNTIGIYFTDDAGFNKHGGGYKCLKVKPQVQLRNAQVVSTRERWTTYQITYTATGGECAFVIGCFERAKVRGFYYADSVFIGPEIEMSDTTKTDSLTQLVIDPQTTVTTVTDDDSLVLIAPGKTLTLENIYFETNKSRILPESYQPLYDIIIELKLQPNLKVEIVGYTDKHGDPKANQKLSEQRANAVADFFISKGIDPSRITTRGEGQSKPVSELDQKNRRVEFIFSE